MNSIFISIISQDEDFLKQTIDDALLKSSGKNKINFGIIEQSVGGNFIDYQSNQSLRIIKKKCGPRGVGIARNESMRLYDGEDYVLILDAHTLFDKGWDENLIRRHKYIEKKENDSVILSQHLAEAIVSGDKIQPLHTGTPPAKNLYFDGLVIRGHEFNEEYIEQYAVTCHFIFGRARAFIDTPFDPRIYYLAEESLFSMRLCTNGYRIFAIDAPPMLSLNKPISNINNDWRNSVDADRMAEDFSILMDYLYWGIEDEWSAKSIESLEKFKKLSKVNISCVFKNLNIHCINTEAVEEVKKIIKEVVGQNHFNKSVFIMIGKIASQSSYII